MVISEIRPQALILLQKSTSTFCRRMTSMGMVYPVRRRGIRRIIKYPFLVTALAILFDLSDPYLLPFNARIM
ncbi:hypothetical protein LENED_008302 [Lentinula edodes]|uniref:Uncharacterized protein n=1 Tax=Lentinula edodes TaxID=5353 RepID=A0A1Q3EGM8_LENED|nr:hypothetical protein LENED_008302 [Lentinula edodes]